MNGKLDKEVEQVTQTEEMKSKPENCSSSSTNDTHSNPPNRLLLLVNPKSGLGKSLKVCEQDIKPHLKSHNIEHEIYITNTNKKTCDYLRDLELSSLKRFRALLIVSGDGLVHEVVNGLMSRQDWKEAMRVPIGVIPTGSGNGLAYTLIRNNHRDLTSRVEGIKVCCRHAIQQETIQADLVKITYGVTQTEHTIWSILSIGWGLMADIDVESDWLRCLGDTRFTIYGLLKTITSRALKAKLSYKLADRAIGDSTVRSENPTDINVSESQDWIHIEDKFSCVYAVYLSHISRKTHFSPKSTLSDQLIYLTFIRGNLNPFRVVEFLLAIDDGSHDKLPYVDVVPVTCFRLQPLEPSRVVVDGEVIPWTLNDGPLTAEVFPKIMKLLWNQNELQ